MKTLRYNRRYTVYREDPRRTSSSSMDAAIVTEDYKALSGNIAVEIRSEIAAVNSAVSCRIEYEMPVMKT